jgi:hypothetical protein
LGNWPQAEPVIAEEPAPGFAAGWRLAATPPLPRGQHITRSMFACLAVAGLGLILLSTQSVRLATYMGWPPFVGLLAGTGLMVRSVLPAHAGRVSGAVGGSAAACLVAWQLSAMTTLVPSWVYLVSAAAALATLVLTISAVSRLASQADAQAGPTGAAPATAYELLLITCVASAATLLSNLMSGEIDPVALLVLLATAAVSGWGIRVLVTERTFMTISVAAGLVALPALAKATGGEPGEITASCLVAALFLALSQLMAGNAWAEATAKSTSWTPKLGTAPGSGALRVASRDLLAWLRTGWPALINGGAMFWLTLVAVAAGALAIVASPLALLHQAGAWVVDSGTEAPVIDLSWLVRAVALVAGAVGAVLAMACGQALSAAAATHDDTGQFGTRLRGGALVTRALDVLRSQMSTVCFYAIGVIVGSLLFVLPGVLLMVRWAFALPAGAATGLRGADALNASWRLTGHRFLPTLAAQVLGGIVTALSLVIAAGCALAAHAAFGSTLIAAVCGAVPATFALTCAAVIMGSLYRQYVSEPRGGRHDR